MKETYRLYSHRTILIDDCGYDSTKFDISDKDKERLYHAGSRGVCQWLDNYSTNDMCLHFIIKSTPELKNFMHHELKVSWEKSKELLIARLQLQEEYLILLVNKISHDLYIHIMQLLEKKYGIERSVSVDIQRRYEDEYFVIAQKYLHNHAGAQRDNAENDNTDPEAQNVLEQYSKLNPLLQEISDAIREKSLCTKSLQTNTLLTSQISMDTSLEGSRYLLYFQREIVRMSRLGLSCHKMLKEKVAQRYQEWQNQPILEKNQDLYDKIQKLKKRDTDDVVDSKNIPNDPIAAYERNVRNFISLFPLLYKYVDDVCADNINKNLDITNSLERQNFDHENMNDLLEELFCFAFKIRKSNNTSEESIPDLEIPRLCVIDNTCSIPRNSPYIDPSAFIPPSKNFSLADEIYVTGTFLDIDDELSSNSYCHNNRAHENPASTVQNIKIQNMQTPSRSLN